jgi:hypothetical protein
MRCRRCGDTVPRLTIAQERCAPCQRDVARVIDLDERRSRVRFPAKELRWAA